MVSLGWIVLSRQGRDEKHYNVVLKIDNNQQIVTLADGMYRKIANPKKKNVKHIENNAIIIDVLKSKIQEDKMLHESEIARHIREFQEKKTKEMIECPNKM